MDDLEFKLMNEAHINYGNFLCVLQRSTWRLQLAIEKGNISNAPTILSDIVSDYVTLQEKYAKIDVARYDKEHGGLIMAEIKEKLPRIYPLIKDIESLLQNPERGSLQEKLQRLSEDFSALSRLGGRFGQLPKYSQYRDERGRRSSTN